MIDMFLIFSWILLLIFTFSVIKYMTSENSHIKDYYPPKNINLTNQEKLHLAEIYYRKRHSKDFDYNVYADGIKYAQELIEKDGYKQLPDNINQIIKPK